MKMEGKRTYFNLDFAQKGEGDDGPGEILEHAQSDP
jgi:hypothetical protein